jgi:hypothetical protein
MPWYFPLCVIAAVLLPQVVGHVIARVCARYSWDEAAWEVQKLMLFITRVLVALVLAWGLVGAVEWIIAEDFSKWQWPFSGEWDSSYGDDSDCLGGPRC